MNTIEMDNYEFDLIEYQMRIRNEKMSDGRDYHRDYNGGMIQSVRLNSVIHKSNKYFNNIALSAAQLMNDDFFFYMELISLSQGNKKKSRLFVYGHELFRFMATPMYRTLKQVFEIIQIWPSIPSPHPNPVPTPDPGDFNLIPSNVKGDCRPVLIIRPDECKSEMGEWNFHQWSEGNSRRHFEDPRVIFYGLNLQPWWKHPEDPYSRELVKNYFETEECFDSILKRAIDAATNCLENSNGEMNQKIIIQVKQITVDNGFLKSEPFKDFEREIKYLNRRWESVNGVDLSIQIV
jgi:hypothetical protein